MCKCHRGKPFEGFEIQNQRTSFLLLWSVFYFYILKLPLVLLSRSNAPQKIITIAALLTSAKPFIRKLDFEN